MQASAVLTIVLAASTCALSAQTPAMTCNDRNWGDGFQTCSIRESTVAAVSKLAVDGRENGGIRIVGANRSDILVRAKIQTSGSTELEANALVSQVSVRTGGGMVTADGPAGGRWSVSYEIFAPANTALALTAHNGGVHLSGLRSDMEIHTVNGGLHLDSLAGYVHGDTVNGGVHVELKGASWDGQGIDVKTNNGGVHINMPQQFSARLELSTVNGGVHVGLPNTQLEKHQRDVKLTLGSGGPTIKVQTQNGGVHVETPSRTV